MVNDESGYKWESQRENAPEVQHVGRKLYKINRLVLSVKF